MTLRVPYLDLQAQYREIRPEIEIAINQVLENCSFILGPSVQAFERDFAAHVGVRHAIGTNSGTSALHLALLAAGIGPGDEVIVPAMTFLATAAAVHYTGATPVVVDVDPVSWTLDPDLVRTAITEQTRALIPVHLYGRCADMTALLAIARDHDLLVVEDAAQAHGASGLDLGGEPRRAGSMARLGAFSFYPGKNLGAYGEAGAVVTDDDELAERVRALRDWGQQEKGQHELLGFNYRMEGLQGAVLGVKLRHLEAWTEERRRVARAYDQQLAEVKGIELPTPDSRGRHVYHVYAVLSGERDRLRQSLDERGIATGIHYPCAIHLQPCLAQLGYRRGQFPVAERMAEQELSLPCYPEMNDAAVEAVVNAVEESVAVTASA